MPRTVADQFVESLVAAGVKRIYAIIGDSLNGLTDAIRRQGKNQTVHVRHEEVAAFTPCAAVHLTGDLAVCAEMAKGFTLHMTEALISRKTDELIHLAKSNLWR
ncbi:thiamine pyrophosphate-binding protein [Rhizobium leguminosarum]